MPIAPFPSEPATELSPEERRVVTELLRAVDGDRRATDVLAAHFRRALALDDPARGRVAQRLYAVLRHRRRLRYAVGSPSDLEAHVLASELLADRLTIATATLARPDRDWTAVANVDERIAEEPDPVRRLAFQTSLPDFIAEALLAERGPEAEALAGALTEAPPQTLRANLFRTSREVLAATLSSEGLTTEPTRFAAHGLNVTNKANVFRSPAFRSGDFEVQDEGSQLVAELVAPPPGGRVIDACAGAGGKTLALASLLQGRGSLLALDPSDAKVRELQRRARRAGASNVRALLISEAGDYPEAVDAWRGRAERVLVDAPCSGVGVWRRNPEARERLQEADLERLPGLQRAIVERALPLLAPGGRLIYATCTVLDRENEAVVSAILTDHPELERVRISEIFGRRWAEPVTRADGFALEVLPHRQGTDGFFAAVLRKRR